MDEGRKRVIGIIAGIIIARNLDRAGDLFGGPQGSLRTDKMIAAAVQLAEQSPAYPGTSPRSAERPTYVL
jgi:hypothetical protein